MISLSTRRRKSKKAGQMGGKPTKVAVIEICCTKASQKMWFLREGTGRFMQVFQVAVPSRGKTCLKIMKPDQSW